MDHYAVLGLLPGAPIEEVRLQFRRLAMVFHPDRNSDDVWCQEQLKRLNSSYEFLADAARKAEYDAALLQRAGERRPEQTVAPPRQLPVSPPASSSPVQRRWLTALFCAAVIGAVLIGILIGFGQAANNPLSDSVTATAPSDVAVSPLAADSPAGSGVGIDDLGSPKEGNVWPLSPPNNGGQTLGGQARLGDSDPPLSATPSPVTTGYWPPATPGNSAPVGP